MENTEQALQSGIFCFLTKDFPEFDVVEGDRCLIVGTQNLPISPLDPYLTRLHFIVAAVNDEDDVIIEGGAALVSPESIYPLENKEQKRLMKKYEKKLNKINKDSN